MIEIFIDEVKVPGLDSELFILWLQDVINTEGFECGDLNVVFVSDQKLLEMNREYLNHDYLTDIITFDYVVKNVVHGELYISIDRVKDNAAMLNETYEKELKRVCVHGVLHLCGYTDKADADIIEMRAKENLYIEKYVSRETE